MVISRGKEVGTRKWAELRSSPPYALTLNSGVDGIQLVPLSGFCCRGELS